MPSIAHAALAASVCAALGAATAGAQDADPETTPTVEALLQCRAIETPLERVACLDARLEVFSAALDEGRLVVVEREAVRAVEREGFGMSLPSMAGLRGLLRRAPTQEGRTVEAERTETLEDGSEVIYAERGGVEAMRGLAVRSVTTNRVGDLVVTLENGQVWAQTDSVGVREPRRNEMDGLTATIEAGALSSFFMELSHTQRRFRARRLR